MNLKRRLLIANATTVLIPVIITVLIALAYIFISAKLGSTNLTIENYQKLSQLKLEIINSQNSILKQTPEAIEDENFQKELQERLSRINGELIILKNDKVIYASKPFSKIDLAKFLEAGSKKWGKEPVNLGNLSYSTQAIDLVFKDSSKGNVLLLVPIDHSTNLNLTRFLVFITGTFTITFLITNIYLTFQLSNTILKPLNNLRAAASEIRKGNLDFQISEEGDIEIRELCRDLELMRVKLKDSINTQLKYEDNRKMLISSISHDLKTPVTSIKGYVEGILDGIANSPEKLDKYLRTIYTKAQRVDIMIDDLLLYAKLDLNQIPFNFERVEISEFLKECLLESEPDLEKDNMKVFFNNELKNNYFVLLDRERMKRVITNILDNSRKYMNKSFGEINVLLRETNSSIVIELKDNGLGINESDLPYIFERFYRSDSSRSDFSGSGLGLAIVKQIIEGHKGRVWAVSNKDVGTSIMISLSKTS